MRPKTGTAKKSRAPQPPRQIKIHQIFQQPQNTPIPNPRQIVVKQCKTPETPETDDQTNKVINIPRSQNNSTPRKVPVQTSSAKVKIFFIR